MKQKMKKWSILTASVLLAMGSLALPQTVWGTDGTNSYHAGKTAADDTKAEAAGNQATAVGVKAQAKGDYANAFGYGAGAYGKNATAIGFSASATGLDSIAIGYQTKASANYTLALGNGAQATKNGAMAFGLSAKASGARDIAVGYNAVAQNLGGGISNPEKSAVAIGNAASATGNGSVALGAASTAEEENTVSVGRKAGEGTAAITRRIVNVAYGTGNNDAAAYGQIAKASQIVKLSESDRQSGDGQENQIVANDGKTVLATFQKMKSVASDDTGFVSGGDLYTETRASIGDAGLNYIAKTKSAGENLTKLDKAIGVVDSENDYAFIKATNPNAEDGTVETSLAQNLINLDTGITKLISYDKTNNGTLYIGSGDGIKADTVSFYGKDDSAALTITRKLTGISYGGDAHEAAAYGQLIKAETYQATSNDKASNVQTVTLKYNDEDSNATKVKIEIAGEGKVDSGDQRLVNGDAVNTALSSAIDKNTYDGSDTISIAKESGDEGHYTVRVKNMAMSTDNKVTTAPTATGTNAFALGAGSNASSKYAQALGTNAQATGRFSIALGYGAEAKENTVVTTDPGSTGSSIAIGTQAVASGNGTVVMGAVASASGEEGIAIGSLAKSEGYEGTAIGSGAYAKDIATTALGAVSSASGIAASAVGYQSKAEGNHAAAFGLKSQATADATLAVGSLSTASALASSAVGYWSTANQTLASAFGYGSGALAEKGTALGAYAKVEEGATNSVALGHGSVASEANVVSVGSTATQRRIVNVAKGTTNTDAATFGQIAVTGQTVSLSKAARKSGSGQENQIVSNDGTVLATFEVGEITSTDTGFVNGKTVYTYVNDIKSGITTDFAKLISYDKTGSGTIRIGSGADITADTVSFLSSGNKTRKLTGITAGKENTDAANVGQLLAGGDYSVSSDNKSTVQSVTISSNDGNTKVTIKVAGDGAVESGDQRLVNGGTVYAAIDKAKVEIAGDSKVTKGDYVKADNTVGKNLEALDEAIGVVKAEAGKTLNVIEEALKPDGSLKTSVSQNLMKIDEKLGKLDSVRDAEGAVNSYKVIKSTKTISENLEALDAAAKGSSADLEEINEKLHYKEATVTGENAIGLGNGAAASAESAVAMGNGAKAEGANAISFGTNAAASKENALAFGNGAKASEANTFAFGNGAAASADSAMAMGNGAKAEGANAISFGTGAAASKENALAFGNGAKASETNTFAFGKDAAASAENAMAFGNGASASGSGSVAIGSGSTATEANVVSVGAAGSERRVTNVAAGVNDTDAVNVGQMNSVVEQNFNSLRHSLTNDINKVAAGSAALAALHPEAFDPDDKFSFAVGYGHYRNANAGAIGAFYKPNEITTISAGATIGNGETMMNMGVSFKLGSSSKNAGKYRTASAVSHELSSLRKNNDRLAADNKLLKADNATQATAIKEQAKEIADLKADNERMKEQIAMILSKMEMSEKVEKTMVKAG